MITDRKINAFTKTVSQLADRPGGTVAPAQLKAQFDSSPEELRVAHNGLVDNLLSTSPGDSGIYNLGMSNISGYTNPQLFLQYLFDTLGGISPAPQSLYRQAIINGNFDIWQRGTSFNGGYTADRWMISYGAGGSATVTRQAFATGQVDVPNNPKYYVQISNNAAVDAWFSHPIEGVLTFAGQKVTISFWARCTSGTYQLNHYFQQKHGSGGSADVLSSFSNHTLTTTWKKYTASVTIPTISASATIGSNDCLMYVFNLPATSGISTIQISQAQVNAGDQALPFQPRSFAEELQMCQRYYEKSYDLAVNPGASGGNQGYYFSVGNSSTATQLAGSPLFKVRKRTAPTVTIYDMLGAVGKASSWNGASQHGQTATVDSLMETRFRVMVSVTSGNYEIFGHWTADAEY